MCINIKPIKKGMKIPKVGWKVCRTDCNSNPISLCYGSEFIKNKWAESKYGPGFHLFEKRSGAIHYKNSYGWMGEPKVFKFSVKKTTGYFYDNVYRGFICQKIMRIK
jgi:hypothetical protein